MSKKKDEKDDKLSPNSLPFTDLKQQKDKPSDQQLRNKMDVINKLSKTPEESFKIQRIAKGYVEELTKREASRAKGAIHYAMGVVSTLPHIPYDQIKSNHDKQDQALRNNVSGQVKEHYERYNTLSKQFGDTQKIDRNQLKDSFNQVKDEPEDKKR